jgi:hypothetical protein
MQEFPHVAYRCSTDTLCAFSWQWIHGLGRPPITAPFVAISCADCRASDGVTLYREAQEWRERVLAELERQRGWVASWPAERALNDRIAELCRERGFTFMSWETAPWDAPDKLPADYNVLNDTLPAAVRLRRRLVAEIESKQVVGRISIKVEGLSEIEATRTMDRLVAEQHAAGLHSGAFWPFS